MNILKKNVWWPWNSVGNCKVSMERLHILEKKNMCIKHSSNHRQDFLLHVYELEKSPGSNA